MSKQTPEYMRRHRRLHAARGKAKDQVCACGKQAQEWAQLKDTDGESPDDYQAMCCNCHRKYDDHWNEEVKAKVAKSSKDRWADPEYKARVGKKISEAKKGHSVSQETREKISRSKTGSTYQGKPRTPEQCENIRIGRWGR